MAALKKTLVKIDFVSDVSCPWCVVGLKSLEEALTRVAPSIQADLHFEPFEINPKMVKEGEEINEHLARKYGGTPAQFAKNREAIRQRGEAVGFTFSMGARARIYNTFDAHRLLHWAGTKDADTQHKLKMGLFTDYFTHGKDPSSETVLVDAAVAAGLDAQEARTVLSSGQFATDVKRAEAKWHAMGINGVPAVIINDEHMISGGQPAEVFEQALRQIASDM
ncbi:Aste57867_1491 [Aphanomyces stellatus]|uniref:Aste57867_1491 protein n=1 Tax=Aphanomyces stellatus TaxID=120398 RepID=A0A485K6E3_9STRA|nr:hypothetical protein As57867_001490 [Aphanomyces stellatus]VFT78707.1 Aste57867_1491 [Aphanomyces stellatus]